MSIAAAALGGLPIAAQVTGKAATRPPRTREAVAKADTVAQPEAR